MALIHEQEPCIWNKGLSELSWETILHGSLHFLHISGAEVLMALCLDYLFTEDVILTMSPLRAMVG